MQLGFSSDRVMTDKSPVQYWFIKTKTQILIHKILALIKLKALIKKWKGNGWWVSGKLKQQFIFNLQMVWQNIEPIILMSFLQNIALRSMLHFQTLAERERETERERERKFQKITLMSSALSRTGVIVIKNYKLLPKFTNRPDKLECLFLAWLSSLV